MISATIEFSGSYGSFRVCATSGYVVSHEPAREQIASIAKDYPHLPGCGYLDVERVDLDERRAWYAAHGVILPDVQPDGDVVDVGWWTALSGYIAAESDWREEIMLARYPDKASS